MASLLDGLIFNALYGSRTLSSLLWTLGKTNVDFYLIRIVICRKIVLIIQLIKIVELCMLELVNE